MTEHEFFTQSVQNNIIQANRISGEILAAKKKHRHRTSRALLPIAACFICILAAVACIPKARAEVLSWFGWSTTPSDYMGKDPQAREDAAQVDALITTISGQENPGVTDEGDFDRVSQLLKERFDVSLSEAMYDGDSIYVTMNLKNGFGVWLLENYTGGTVASVAIPPEKLGDFFNPVVPDSYLTGEDVYYSHTMGRMILTLPDGTSVSGSIGVAQSEALTTLLKTVADDPQNVDALVAAYLENNDVKAHAALKADPARLSALADENGVVTGKVSLLLQIELDGSVTGTPTTVLEADVGDVTINATIYRDFVTGATGSTEEQAWSGQTIMTYFDDSNVDGSTYGYNVYTNRTLKLDGLTMKPLSAEVDATGIRKVQVEITYPDNWTDEDFRQFHNRYGIQFKVLINGQEGDWIASGVPRFGSENPRQRTWYCRQVQMVPLALLPEITELTLIPYISYCTAYTEIDRGTDGNQEIYGKTTSFELNEPFSLWNAFSGEFDMETTYFPQYAMTFHIPQN